MACALCLSTGAMAQTDSLSNSYRPYAPASLPAGAPAWMAELACPERVNYHAVTDSFTHFLLRHPDARRKTPLMKATVNYFRRWQKAYEPYVRADGSIRMPDMAAVRDYVRQANQRTAHPLPAKAMAQDATAGWQLLSPIVTYDYKTKQLSPAQANVQRLGISKSDPNTLYCGTETGMVFKSVDKGQHWTPTTGSYYLGGEITTIDVSPTDAEKVVVGAGPFLWLTTDGGRSWTDITPGQLGSSSARTRDALFAPTHDNRIMVGTDAGIYVSEDGGVTWTSVAAGQCFDLKYKHGDTQTVYAMLRQGSKVNFCVSTNGGKSFSQRMPQLAFSLACGRIGLSAAPSGRDYIYVWACRNDGIGSVNPPFYAGAPVLMKSKDGGATWTVYDKIAEQMESHDRAGGQGYYDMVVTASDTDPEHVLFGLLQLYRSDDGGATLSNVGGYYGKFDLHCDMQDIYTSGGDTWLSTDGGVIYSPDFFGSRAEARINGIYASEFWGFDQGWNEDVMVGGRNHNGNMSQMDRYNGATISMKGSERSTGYVFLSNPRKIAYQDSENVIMPDDWHDEFVPFYGFWNYPAESTQFGLGFEFDPRYAKSFLIIKGEWDDDFRTLWKTVDDGESFVQLHQFPQPITSHVISRSNPDKIVVTTRSNVYCSMDGGQTFEAMPNLPAEIVNALKPKAAIHPRNENEIWITTGTPGGMYRTTDNGLSWEQLDRGLSVPATGEQYLVNRFFLTGNDKDAAYAAGSVYRSLNNGYMALRSRVLYWDESQKQWTDFSEGLPPVITINRMLPFYKEGKIRIATNNGIWQRDLNDREFRPIAQPLILNRGQAEEPGRTNIEFDSYSIVNQQKASWKWAFDPQPLFVSNPEVRNPVVTVADGQSYDVTLTVATPAGTDTKTVRRMIAGDKDVPNGITGEELLPSDILLSSSHISKGQTLTLTPRNIHAPCQWKLFDTSGRIVQTLTVEAQGQTTIATDGLATGVHYYLLTGNGFKKAGKMTVSN